MTFKSSPLRQNEEFLADVRSKMSKKDIIAKWECSSGLIVNLRKDLGEIRDPARAATPGDSENHDESGSHYTIYNTKAWGKKDFDEFLRSHEMDPEETAYNWGWTSHPMGGFWNKLNNVRPKSGKDGGPEWPLIQQATPVAVNIGPIPARPARGGLKMSIKGADAQIGFRAVDETFESFHDQAAMDLFVEVVRREQPEEIALLGDMIDLPSQSRWAQEAGFARTTQMALDALHSFLAQLRAAAPEAFIILIEGNHDKRMQTFIETNALAAFGLKRANMPESWPTMSLPFLLRLDELNIQYQDAYPAAVHWDDDSTRNIHGTRANSKGSTMSQYAQELPHINTWAGHTHRTEIIYKTVLGPRGEAIESYSANPGCLCKTDGTVPSVHGAIHSDGSSARVVEDWQQGFGVNLFDGRGNSWPQVYRIKDGVTVYGGKVLG
jgi:hypothetical protein